MTHIREGAKVSYIGYPEGGLTVGDQGQVVAASGSASHVRWDSGVVAGQILLVENEDLVQATAARTHEDIDFAHGPLVSLAVRDIYDESGEVGLLNAMAEAGHLAGFTEIAEEALGFVQGKVAADPSVAEALTQLDPAEQTEVLSMMATALLRDAFGRGE